MAPLKRSRDGLDVSNIQFISAAVRQNGHKKARISADHNISESENDHPQYRRRANDEVLSMTQHEKNRDADYSYLANEEEADARATQAILARVETLGENIPADNGIIEYVTMGNFMCHVHLHVKLGPLINFIIGENGSGKSTILTAITICLGGKTSMTNRGGSLKEYIKSGEEAAEIKLALKNEGIDAYQPDVYGARIIVKRTFTRSGSSGYKLLNENGRIVSTKRADLDDLVEYFQMQIDNPMNILTQDAARQFLNQTNASQKYKFFIKGIQLEQMDNDYRIVQETCDAMEARLHDQVDSVKILEKKKKAANDKLKAYESHREFNKKLRTLSYQSAWAQVEAEERDLIKAEGDLQKAKDVIESLRDEAEVKAALFEQADLLCAKLEASVQRAVEGLETYRENEAAAKAEFDSTQAATNRALQEQRQVKEEKKDADERAKSLSTQIQSEENRLESISGGGHAKLKEEMDKVEARKKEADEELEARHRELPGLRDALHSAEERLKRSKEPIRIQQQQIHECEAKLSALSQETIDPMAGFDPNMPRLLKLIDQERDWKEKPIGPCGLYIKLLQPGWSSILENTLGGMLTSFVVTSKADQERLQGLMRRISVNGSSIYIGNHKLLDTTGHEPDIQHDTTLRVLDIQNELVKKQLIINQGIEQTLLIENLDDATRIMYDGPKPEKVRACLTKHPNRRGAGVRLAWVGQGFQKQDPLHPLPPRHRPRMRTTAESQIAEQRGNLEYLRKELTNLESERRQADQGVSKCLQALKHHSNSVNNLKDRQQRAANAIDNIRDELDKNDVASGKLDTLKASLREAQEAFAIHEHSYEAIGKDLDEQKENSRIAKAAHDATIAERQAHEHKIKKMQKHLHEKKDGRQICLLEKNNAFEAIEKEMSDLPKFERAVERQKEVVTDFVSQASQVCERVEVPLGRTVKDIDIELQALDKTKKAIRAQLGGSEQEIVDQAAEATRIYDSAKIQDAQLRELLARLKNSYMMRLEIWRRFLKHICARTRGNFTYLLSERGFRGHVRMDHKQKLLELNIEPDETVKSTKGRQTKTLSGGEKSFSSICLLLSLWEAMGAPLRCLDEFDVFMDQVNRDVSTGLIIQAARRSVGRQYILITPNAIGGNGSEKAKLGDDVKIIRLNDPRQKAIDDMMNGTGTNIDSD